MESGDRLTAVLSVEGLRLSLGAREILRGVSFQAARGELVALMGVSGGGKTTALRAVAALEPFQAGTIVVDGITWRAGENGSVTVLRRKVGMVFQFHHLFSHLTALQNVALAPIHVQRRTGAEAEELARHLLDALGVAGRADALPRELSGGEAQRVAIARALAMDPPLLLMDEPTASLDPARRDELGETLQALAADGRTLVIATHDDDFARDWAHRVVVLSDGEVVEEGPATRLLLLSKERKPSPRAG